MPPRAGACRLGQFDVLRAELNDAAALTGQRQPGGWALFGSAVLLMEGLRERSGDVDVFVAPALWEHLAGRVAWRLRLPDPVDPPYLERLVVGVRVHAFYSWTARDPHVNADQCLAAATLVQGWWCTPLELVRGHKAMCAGKHPGDPRHAKHVADVAAIDVYLARAAA